MDTVFSRINVPGTEAENEPLGLFDSMKLTVWTLEYVNFKWCKYDTDWFGSFWDMASQSQKSGGTFIQAGVFIRQN